MSRWEAPQHATRRPEIEKRLDTVGRGDQLESVGGTNKRGHETIGDRPVRLLKERLDTLVARVYLSRRKP